MTGTPDLLFTRKRRILLIPILAAAGGVCALIGVKAEISALTTTGFCCIGGSSIFLGVDVMISRRIVLRSRYDRRASETYTGIAAIAQGIDLVLLGMFFAGGAVLAHVGLAHLVVLFLIRRPGALLLLFGWTCLTAAVTVGVGYVEQKETSRFAFILDFLTSRLLGGGLLIVLGVGATALGLLEIFAPETFDAWGGGYLEVLFGAE